MLEVGNVFYITQGVWHGNIPSSYLTFVFMTCLGRCWEIDIMRVIMAKIDGDGKKKLFYTFFLLLFFGLSTTFLLNQIFMKLFFKFWSDFNISAVKF